MCGLGWQVRLRQIDISRLCGCTHRTGLGGWIPAGPCHPAPNQSGSAAIGAPSLRGTPRRGGRGQDRKAQTRDTGGRPLPTGTRRGLEEGDRGCQDRGWERFGSVRFGLEFADWPRRAVAPTSHWGRGHGLAPGGHQGWGLRAHSQMVKRVNGPPGADAPCGSSGEGPFYVYEHQNLRGWQ